jgi:polysaccharide export outer membrane protein
MMEIAPLMRTLAVATLVALGTAAPAFAQTDASPDGLQPGDIINLRIWREPDMTGQFMVQEDGTAVLPRLGPVVVVGKEAETLKRELIEEYSKTLRNTSIEIILQRRVTITGEVRAPGLYPVDPTMSLTDALALAGGPLGTADRNRVILIRAGTETDIDTEEALRLGDLSLRSGDQLYVPPQSWFRRNWPMATSILATVLTLTTFILSR